MKNIILTIIMFAGINSAVWAQVDDVTLVVSGEGATKDEATTKALRSAIEQSFGVFVSANTEILNDELVKDEIATVSSGNVKKYTELGAITKPNGNIEVSLQATVSVKKLTSYAQSHGSSTEFAGATFAANLKLIKLNRENTKKAYENLVKQVQSFGGNLFDCEIRLGNPQANGQIPVTLFYYTTEKSAQLADLIISTLDALSMNYSNRAQYLQDGVETYQYMLPSNCINSGFYNSYYGNDMYTKGIRFVSFLEPLPQINILPNVFQIYDNMGNNYPMYVDGGRNKLIIHNNEQFEGGIYRDGYYASVGEYVYQQKYSGKNIYISKSEKYIAIPSEYKGAWRKEKQDKNKIRVFVPQKIYECKGFINVPTDRLEQITDFTVKVNGN